MVATRSRPVAVVTGASSGIGAATVVALGRKGYQIVAGARRLTRVKRVVGDLGMALPLDVTDQASIDGFVAQVSKAFGRIDVLVNNAGLALGLTAIEKARDEDWIGMWETNVLGLMRVTRACIPLLRKAKHGHIVNLGSIAGFETYKGGAGYTATKHAVRAISRTLRLELNGEPIRVTEVAPGMVETEFSVVRFGGDRKAAKAVYQGVKPLVAEDIADCIVYAVTRPPHVDIDEIVVRPVAQAATFLVARKT
ncbi:MAG: SDR family NAD(P)-dependent oxidoreductase [Chloroflexi bacterium]|nr:MAG: SDR family NAD(P)-dependent oxidoreductase [Chloroflexota bacterium]TMC71724.1 MAG: SDR family NAD(P)-dependent oxidoreductase [Chloroflexota bacterium]